MTNNKQQVIGALKVLQDSYPTTSTASANIAVQRAIHEIADAVEAFVSSLKPFELEVV